MLLQDLAKFYLAPQTTARELFQLGKADEIFENEEFVKALEIYGEKYERWIDEKEFDALVKRAERSYKSAMADIETLMSDESSARDKKFAISRERNNCNPFQRGRALPCSGARQRQGAATGGRRGGWAGSNYAALDCEASDSPEVQNPL